VMDKNRIENRRLIIRYFFVIFVIVAILVTGAGFYYLEKRDYLSRLKLEGRVSVKLQIEKRWTSSRNWGRENT